MIGTRRHPGPPVAIDPVVRDHPLNVGKVGWWLARPGLMGGMRVVDLMGRHHGVYTVADGRPRWSDAAGRPGGLGSIYLGTGTGSSYVSVPVHPENSLVRDWTYAISVRTDALIGSNQTLFSRWQSSGAGRQIFIYFDPSGTVKVDVPFIATIINSTSGVRPVVAGRWCRVAVTRVGNLWTTYVDADVSETATNSAAQEAPTVPMEIGYCLAQAGSQLIGRWDDAALWNRGLSQAELRAELDLSRAGYPGALRTRAMRPLAEVTAASPRPGRKGGGGKGAGNAVYRLGTRTPGTPTPGL